MCNFLEVQKRYKLTSKPLATLWDLGGEGFIRQIFHFCAIYGQNVLHFHFFLHFCLFTTVSRINWEATLEFTLALFTEAPTIFMCKPVKKSFLQVKEGCLCVLHDTDRHSELKTSACHIATWLWNGSPKSFPECAITRQTSLPSCL